MAAPSGQVSAGFRAAAAAALPAPVPCNTVAGSCWRPPLVATWQYQLQGSVNSSGQCIYPSTGFINTAITGTSFATGKQVAPTVFDIDIYQDGKCYTPNNYGVLNSAAVNALHAQGDKVIGYIDAGTAETWRPDYPQYSSFNASCGGCLLGKPVGGFRDEFWLNINTNVSGVNPNTGQTETAQQFIIDELSARLDKAKSLGADAIEFDNVDAYQNKTGLSISAATQEQFDATIANLAHSKGFTVGLKNDLGQANDLQPYFDFAINEQCWQYNECNYPPPGPAGVARHLRQGRVQRRVQAGRVKVLPAGQFGQLQLQLDTQERQPVRRPLRPLPLSRYPSAGHTQQRSMRQLPRRRITSLVRTARPAPSAVPGYHNPHGGASPDARGRLGWHGRNAVP